jgi:hypothetical protein
MMAAFNRLRLAPLALVLVLHMPVVAQAQQCTADQFGASVDQAGAALREIMRVNQPKLDQKIKALKAKNNWTEAEAEDKALEALSDARTAELDRTANDLLARIDQLGNLPAKATPECARLQELEAASLELQAAVRAKSNYMLTRADAVLGGSVTAAAPVAVAPKASPPAAPTPVVKAAPAPAPWSTTTTVDAQSLPPLVVPPSQPVTPAPTREDDGFTIDEIVRASTGVFGKVSAGIGSLVEHTFSQIGRPTGYIIGQEGGGAFLAGLRYGSGTLYLRDGRTMPIHWHGPSVGLDFGAQGAKIMFLVYRLRDPEQLVPTFTSIEGQAFVAGGIGVTLMTNGDAQLAPIRSGLGFRLGASVGYVRFTRKPTWNPF